MKKIAFCANEIDRTGAIACLSMLFKHYNIVHSFTAIDSQKKFDCTLLEIAESKGLRCITYVPTHQNDFQKLSTPFIVRFPHDIYVIVFQIKSNKITYADPQKGVVKTSTKEFYKEYNISVFQDIEAFVFIASPKAHQKKLKADKRISSFSYYASYAKPYQKYFVQLGIGLVIGSLLQFVPPFLTQILVDKAVNFKDLNLTNLILIGLLAIAVGKLLSQFIRDWITFYISNRLNITIVADFIQKVLYHPMPFFEGRNVGDLLQRIGDHKRIENFITNSLLNILFALLNLIIYGSILAYFSFKIFLIFAIGSILYFVWTILFFKIRKEIDVSMFQQNAYNQNLQIQLLQGIQEIKLQGCEKEKKWEWEKHQVLLLKSQTKMLKIEQAQTVGSTLINETKNILILFFSAKLAITGDISLGTMLAIQYILGYANVPINQSIKFLQDAQFATISMNRLAQISDSGSEYNKTNEVIDTFPINKSIILDKTYFRYEIANEKKDNSKPSTLKNISITIPEGKVTGIIGTSGSGKTTLLKLLLKLYSPTSGTIKLGTVNFNSINTKWWRNQCGAIFQDSILFNDTVISNIGGPDKEIDTARLLNAVALANIQEDIEKMPLGYNTKIGPDGLRVSQGQKQRILIARLIYRNPKFIFLDEATNALDPINEKEILENLLTFFKGKTIVMVTHRLHTVTNADFLAVMNNGKVEEFGTPDELRECQGLYCQMVNNE